jgi:hypothetical protein
MGKHHLAVLEWVKTAPTVNVSADWIMFSISTDRAIVEKHTLCELSDYYLVDLAEGLVHHPQAQIAACSRLPFNTPSVTATTYQAL